MKNIIAVIIAIALAQAAGLIGSYFTFDAIPTWYAGLVKPSFTPPSWVFGPVWVTLYTLMGVASFLVWKRRYQNFPVAKRALAAYGVQLVANATWSILFFGFRSPGAAFANIILLLALILATIHGFQKIHRAAAYLLIPYLLWVTFAAKLNYAIWQLN